MDSTKLSVERPKSFRERQTQAEEAYQGLFAMFKTHRFIDWGILTQVQEDGYTTAVPPYCFRFDEFLGYWLSGCEPQGVPAIMEKYFPEPDEMDCSYLEDVLAGLEKVSGGPRDVYMTSKGSNLGIGPGVCWCYADNVTRAQKWVRDAKENLLVEKMLLLGPPASRLRVASTPKSVASLLSFFQNGFTVEEFDRLLIKLGMMNESRKLTEDSKPRTWVSVIQALRDEKLLLPPSNPALHDTLIQEYKNQDGLPKLRTLQEGYNPDNTQARDFYIRAKALLKAR